MTSDLHGRGHEPMYLQKAVFWKLIKLRWRISDLAETSKREMLC